MKKRRRKRRGDLRRDHSTSQTVTELAAGGASSDLIAAVIGVGRDRLRSEHTLALHAGRTAKQKAEAKAKAAELSKEDAAQLDRIKRSFESHWFDPVHGNDLYGGAMNVAEALEWCKQFKSARQPNEDSNGSSGDQQ